MKIILLGPPGVGKGTMAKKICSKYNIPHISTGDIFRDNITRNTNLGKEAKKYIDKGRLVPDKITIEEALIRIGKKDCRKGYILDGFPRTIPQARELDKAEKIDVVLNLIATQKTILQRLGGRVTCPLCGRVYHLQNCPPKKKGICDKDKSKLIVRDDQKGSVIKERLKVYVKNTEPLINYYTKKKLIIDIDANPQIPALIFKSIRNALDNL